MIKELRPKLAKMPGIVVYMQNPPAIQIGGRVSKSLYQFTMQSSDIASLYPAADALVDAARKSALLQDVTSDLQLGNPQASVADRPRARGVARRHGGADRDGAVRRVRLAAGVHDLHAERRVLGRDGAAAAVPARPVGDELAVRPLEDRRARAAQRRRARSRRRRAPLIGQPLGTAAVGDAVVQPAPGVALGQATAEVQRIANKMLPSSITTGFSGTAQAFQSTQAGMLALLGIAIFVIYVVLGVLYESFIHPITILSGLPFAAFGALLTLLDLQDRPERVRVRRHHPARRSREEERDHDDRLRARGRAERRGARRRTRSCTRA